MESSALQCSRQAWEEATLVEFRVAGAWGAALVLARGRKAGCRKGAQVWPPNTGTPGLGVVMLDHRTDKSIACIAHPAMPTDCLCLPVGTSGTPRPRCTARQRCCGAGRCDTSAPGWRQQQPLLGRLMRWQSSAGHFGGAPPLLFLQCCPAAGVGQQPAAEWRSTSGAGCHPSLRQCIAQQNKRVQMGQACVALGGRRSQLQAGG